MVKKTNNNGFSAVEGLLILVIVGIAGFVGWFVWHSQRAINDTQNATVQGQGTIVKTSKEVTGNKVTTVVDPTASWVSYTDIVGKFSLKYPPSWVKASNPSLCSPGIFLFGPSKATVGACGSENFGEVFITSVDGDHRSDSELSTGYQKLVKTDVTVSQVVGKKESGTTHNQQGMGAFPDGVKEVRYIFYTGGRTYVVGYDQHAAMPDVLSDFNLIVTKTLKFQ